MSVHSKVIASCDTLLIALIGVLQLGVFGAFIEGSAPREPVVIDTNQPHVEVVVVEAARIT